eukprot:851930-Rhodomonas_salina.3
MVMMTVMMMTMMMMMMMMVVMMMVTDDDGRLRVTTYECSLPLLGLGLHMRGASPRRGPPIP